MTKKNIYFIIIVLYQNTFYATNKPLSMLLIDENSVFENSFTTKRTTINGLEANGIIECNTNNSNFDIIFTTLPEQKLQIIIQGLPFIIPAPETPISFLAIDNKQKVFIQEDNEIEKKIIINDNFNDDNSLNIINLTSNTINQYQSPLLISSTVNDNSIFITFGNTNNPLTIVSNAILSINNLKFNNTINYPIIILNNVTAKKTLKAESLIIQNELLLDNMVSIDQIENNIIKKNLINTNSQACTIQGTILFNAEVKLGIENTPINMYLFTTKNQLLFPEFFLGIDTTTNQLTATKTYPILNTIETNCITSTDNLQITSINTLLTVGNNSSNIIFTTPQLFLNNTINTNLANVFTYDTDTIFKQPVTFNSLNYAYYLIGKNTTTINAPVIIQSINLNGKLFFPNLPVIENFVAYLGINTSEELFYLTTIPIESTEKKKTYYLKQITLKHHKQTQNKIITKKLFQAIPLAINAFFNYLQELKYNNILKKIILHYLKNIDKKKINANILNKIIRKISL